MRYLILLLLLVSSSARATVEVGTGGAGAGVATYSDAGSLPATASDGATAVTLDSHGFYIYNLGSLAWILQSGSTGLAGPGSSVDSEIMLFSGTGGATAKRATGTGVVHATSGVFSVGTVTVPEGGTGATTLTSNGMVYGNGTSAVAATAAGSQYQSLQAGSGGTPAFDALHLDQAAATTGLLPVAKGGTAATDAATARSNLTAAKSGANTDITSLTLPDATGNTGGINWDSDTRVTSPGDGVISVYANNVMAAQFNPNGINQIRAVDYVWPGSQGSATTFLMNNGSGSLSWSSVPWETPGTIGSSTPSTGNFTTLAGQKIVVGVGDPTTACVQFDNDTGLCSPGDGELEVWGNNTIGARFNSNGISEVRGVSYLWPNAQGAAGDVLTNDGSGNLSWAEGGTGPLSITDSYDAGTLGSADLNSVDITVSPTTDASGANLNLLRLNSAVNADEALGSLNGISMGIATQQSGNTGEMNAVAVSLASGNNTTPTTTNFVRNLYFVNNLGTQTTLGGFEGLNLSLTAPAGSSVGDYSFIRDNSPIDHFTAGYSTFESRKQVGTVDQNAYGFMMNDNIGTANQDVTAFYSTNTWDTVNNWRLLSMDTTINNFDAGLVFDIHPALGTQGQDNQYNILNHGASFDELDSYTGWSEHMNGTLIRKDYDLIETSSNIDTVTRNVNRLNFHDQFDTVGGSYTGMSDSTNIDTIVGGTVTGISLNFRAEVPGDSYGINLSPQVTQRGLTAQVDTVLAEDDVAGATGGKYWRKCTAYSENPNTCFKVWYDVDNGSTPPSAGGDTLVEVDISTGDSAAAIGNATSIIVDALSLLDATDDGFGLITVSTIATGRAGNIDSGNIGWTSETTQGGGGDGRHTGYLFGGGQLSGYGSQDDGSIVAFDSGGYPVNFGKLNAGLNHTIASSTPNPYIGHVMNMNLSLGDGQTITDGDSIGVGGIGQITLGAGSTVTSGGLGVGTASQGKIALLNFGAGSTMQNIESDIAPMLAVGGSGNVANGAGYMAFATNAGSSMTMTNYRAFWGRNPPYGVLATNNYGLYAENSYVNFMGGSLKIGGAGNGTNDQVQSANAGLEIEEKHIRVIGTTPTATPDANAGTGATCQVLNATDTAGIIQLTTTAVVSASGDQCAITFAADFGTAPVCVVSPHNQEAGVAPTLVSPYFNATTTDLVVAFAVADAVGATYQWDFHCIETQ